MRVLHFIYKGVGGPKGPLAATTRRCLESPTGANNTILDRGGFNNGADAHEKNAILHNSAGCLWCHSDRVVKLLSMDRVLLHVLSMHGIVYPPALTCDPPLW